MNERIRFPVEGMTCTSCASRVTRAVRKLDGVESVKVDLGADSATVGFDAARTTRAAIGEAVRKAGYDARIELASAVVPRDTRGILARFGLRS